MKDLEILKDRINGLIMPLLQSLGLQLVDIEIAGRGRGMLLRIFIDKEGGVNIGDCEMVSREVGAVLDVEDPIPSSYTLEVSSPGLDRPLRNLEEYKRFVGRMVRVITKTPIENQSFFVGRLVSVSDGSLILSLPKDKTVTVPCEDILRARLEVEF